MVFDCNKALKLYKCYKCDYTINEKVCKFLHICGVNETKSGVKFKQCIFCNIGSFSYGWWYFHEKKCTSNQTSSTFTKKCMAEGYDYRFQCDQRKCSNFVIIWFNLIYFS